MAQCHAQLRCHDMLTSNALQSRLLIRGTLCCPSSQFTGSTDVGKTIMAGGWVEHNHSYCCSLKN